LRGEVSNTSSIPEFARTLHSRRELPQPAAARHPASAALVALLVLFHREKQKNGQQADCTKD
jgi:hypothetical protein